MSNNHQTLSLFRSLIQSKRFDQGTLRILDSVLISRDVKSMLDVRKSLVEYMRRESVNVIRQVVAKTVEEKLLIVEFFVKAFAVIGDMEVCSFEFRGELTLLAITSRHVSYEEWFTFAEHALENRFSVIARKIRKACEKALGCFQMDDMLKTKDTETLREQTEAIRRINRLKDIAMVRAASQSDSCVLHRWSFLSGLTLSRLLLLRNSLPMILTSTTSGLRIYRGSKRNESAPPHFCKASGGIVCHILQQLETMKIIDIDPKGGKAVCTSLIFIDGLEFVKALMSKLISERRIKAPTTKSPTKLKKMLESKFHKSFYIEMPDLETRERMANILLQEVKVDEEEKKKICQFLAYDSDGLVWVDLERVCIEAGVLAKYEEFVQGGILVEVQANGVTKLAKLQQQQKASRITVFVSAAVWNDVTQQLEELKQRAEALGHRVEEL
ncbi:protein double-strand break formation [Tanacetum coccineum]